MLLIFDKKKLFWSCFEFGANLCSKKSEQIYSVTRFGHLWPFNYLWKNFWVKATLFCQCQHRIIQLIWHKIAIWPFLRKFWLVENVQSGHCERNIPITILKLCVFFWVFFVPKILRPYSVHLCSLNQGSTYPKV